MRKPKSLFLTEDLLGSVTDLYQLTMAAGYFEHNMHDRVTFDLFVRHLPENRSYLIVAGLEQALHYLTHVRFSPEIIKYLKQLPVFHHVSQEFFDYLQNFSFSGTVYAMPEGTIAFADEPILRITAPIIEAQIVETYLLAIINFQTLIATKASRIVYAAKGRDVIDFGTRRAHGPQAGVIAARASFIGGCSGTSNVFTAYELGIPAVGTVAHSWVMAFEDELTSFYKFSEVFPDHTILIIDTYDTPSGAKVAAKIGNNLKGVRIDSGDLLQLSKHVRKILDTKGLQHVKIVASGDLNEIRIDNLIEMGAPIDAFGVGTELATSKDAPALGGVYKLVEQEHNGKYIPRMKTSERKTTYPCRKQVFRLSDREGRFIKDIVGLEDENIEGTPLLVPVMKDGRILYNLPEIYEIQQTAMSNLAHLPEPFKHLHDPQAYPVIKSQKLETKKQEIMDIIKHRTTAFDIR